MNSFLKFVIGFVAGFVSTVILGFIPAVRYYAEIEPRVQASYKGTIDQYEAKRLKAVERLEKVRSIKRPFQ